MLRGESNKLVEIQGDLAVSDLEIDADSFTLDLEIAEYTNGGIPAIRITGVDEDDESIPVSLRSISGLTWLPLSSKIKFSEMLHYAPIYTEILSCVSHLFKINEPPALADFHTISPDEALKSFRKHAVDFLATRIAAVRNLREEKEGGEMNWGADPTLNLMQTTGGREIATPGCYFRVSTRTPGLRVFWSGAYYLSPNYFNSPTSPVASILQAGRYLFGVDGGAYSKSCNSTCIQWDTNAVVSLPGNSSVHLNY